MMTACACCAVVGKVVPELIYTFTIHAGPICAKCYAVDLGLRGNKTLADTHRYRPVTDPEDPRLADLPSNDDGTTNGR